LAVRLVTALQRLRMRRLLLLHRQQPLTATPQALAAAAAAAAAAATLDSCRTAATAVLAPAPTRTQRPWLPRLLLVLLPRMARTRSHSGRLVLWWWRSASN
jgi:hypothetical protein